MRTENISRFLEKNYSDEQLAALLAHAESGRLSYNSCCCLVGIPLATHALRGEHEYDFGGEGHLERGRELPWAKEAEFEFALLGPDLTRRRILVPLVLAEMERREKEKDRRDRARSPLRLAPQGKLTTSHVIGRTHQRDTA